MKYLTTTMNTAACTLAALTLGLTGCGQEGAYGGANSSSMTADGANDGARVVARAVDMDIQSGRIQEGPIAPEPDQTVDQAIGANQGNPRMLVVAGGCFWCAEAVFEHTKGVTRVVSGFAGGDKTTAQYDTVSSGGTRHAESIQITYNPRKVSFGQLMRVYFTTIFPTQANGQGPDIGDQYRAEIFYSDDAQHAAAEAYLKQLRQSGIYQDRIATKLGRFTGFYPAVEYHQDYVKKYPDSAYVVQNSIPKLAKFKQGLPDLYRESWGPRGQNDTH